MSCRPTPAPPGPRAQGSSRQAREGKVRGHDPQPASRSAGSKRRLFLPGQAGVAWRLRAAERFTHRAGSLASKRRTGEAKGPAGDTHLRASEQRHEAGVGERASPVRRCAPRAKGAPAAAPLLRSPVRRTSGSPSGDFPRRFESRAASALIGRLDARCAALIGQKRPDARCVVLIGQERGVPVKVVIATLVGGVESFCFADVGLVPSSTRCLFCFFVFFLPFSTFSLQNRKSQREDAFSSLPDQASPKEESFLAYCKREFRESTWKCQRFDCNHNTCFRAKFCIRFHSRSCALSTIMHHCPRC